MCLSSFAVKAYVHAKLTYKRKGHNNDLPEQNSR